MKKVKYLILLLITIFAFNINVSAASGSLSASSSSVYVGDSFTVTANVYSAAAWNVHTSASGPVSGCVINQADATADAMDTNKVFTATCTATGEGTITVRLSGDVTSASDGIAVGISGSRVINVSKRPAPSNNTNNNSSNNTSKNNNSNSSRSNNNTNSNNVTENKSNNSNIKELSADGYELVKVDSNNYTLTVSNDVESINIKASAEDSKAQLSGSGNHSINVGENNIEVVVTAEDGSQNKINIKVVRKDGFYLDDLDLVLKGDKNNDVIIKSDSIIKASDLEKIKNSGKIINFNYFNSDKSLSYSWIVDGSKLKNVNDLDTSIVFNSDNKKDMLRLSNYADGLFIGLKQSNNIPTGIKIKLFVGDKYEDHDMLNIYGYLKNTDKLELVKSKVEVKNGFIEFELSDASDYLITMSNIPNLKDSIKSESKNSLFSIFLIVIILLLLIIGIMFILLKKRRNKEKNNENDNDLNINSSDKLESKYNDNLFSEEINNELKNTNGLDKKSVDDFEYLNLDEDDFSKNSKSSNYFDTPFNNSIYDDKYTTSDNMPNNSENENE